LSGYTGRGTSLTYDDLIMIDKILLA